MLSFIYYLGRAVLQRSLNSFYSGVSFDSA